ncbi:MAG: peptidoglycan DD-metalloendopeptidase family protein [Vampirovibrio sp.]|nr:peptidoglycan DD-metalloendopeptidase family protein [Vampirovibrio sp.]
MSTNATWGEDSKALQLKKKQLQEKQRALQEIKRKKEYSRRKARGITSTIVKNQRSLENTRSLLYRQQNNRRNAQLRLVELEDALMTTSAQTQELAKNASNRVRKLYMDERLTLLQMILDAKDISTLMDRLFYKQKMVSQDKKLMSDYRETASKLKSEQKRIALQKQKINQIIGKIDNHKRSLASQLQKDKVRRRQYQKDAAYYERAERELLAESESIKRELAGKGLGKDVAGSTGKFVWPLRGTITSNFGYRTHPVHRRRLMHTGLDIAARSGTPVKAADGGKVIQVKWRGGYGKVVMINHGIRNGKNLVTLYGHLRGWAVKTGQMVSKGQTVAYVGSTGVATGPHLHFEARENGTPVNPRKYLP